MTQGGGRWPSKPLPMEEIATAYQAGAGIIELAHHPLLLGRRPCLVVVGLGPCRPPADGGVGDPGLAAAPPLGDAQRELEAWTSKSRAGLDSQWCTPTEAAKILTCPPNGSVNSSTTLEAKV